MKRVFVCLIILLCSGLAYAGNVDSLLRVLDAVIQERNVYGQSKESQMSQIKSQLKQVTTDADRYILCTQLFNHYLPYNTDSALAYAQRKYAIAKKLNHNSLASEAQLNMVSVMITTGNYKEALDLLLAVRKSGLTGAELSYYYQLNRTVYAAMADFTAIKNHQQHYTQLSASYRDSMLEVMPATSRSFFLVRCDDLIINKQFDEALACLKDTLRKIETDSHDCAIVAYMISDAYSGKGDKDLAKEYLIRSAIADLRSVVKEYISLWKLATMLYNDGDIDRAYSYLRCSLEDAIFSNARLRTIKISQIFPIIDKAYQLKSQKQRQQMMLSMGAISLLTLFLLIAIVYVLIQIRKLKVIKQQLSDTNKQLNDSNNRLTHLNVDLTEASHIKEEYIGRYMDLCSAYIEKMDDYRRMLNKMATAGKIEDLFQTIKSSQFISNELKEFYASFDDTFLRLFPNFVEEFNNLLTDNEKVYPKAGERLNTELRIFALIRLGITDSEKIAHFLRYSITTIYNYRTKVRNKAAGVRNDFEKKVMEIGA